MEAGSRAWISIAKRKNDENAIWIPSSIATIAKRAGRTSFKRTEAGGRPPRGDPEVDAETLAVAVRLQPPDETLHVLRRVFSLERGLAAGLALFQLRSGLHAGVVRDEWRALAERAVRAALVVVRCGRHPASDQELEQVRRWALRQP